MPSTTLRGFARRAAEFLDWCPPHLRADFRRLRDNQGFTSAEARRIIEDHMAVEARRQQHSTGKSGSSLTSAR